MLGRFHVIERVSSEQFASLLQIANVILHPFPFDGSKTSADSLEAGVPLLTLPTEYLRGRMGAAFLRTMNMPELVARSVSDYIDIAEKLGTNKDFYLQTKKRVVAKVDLIWEDLEVPFGWVQFLSTVIGRPSPSWDEFVGQTGRNVSLETRLRDTRRANQLSFDKTWGPESWLLHKGVALLESYLDDDEVPRIFNNWKGIGRNNIINSNRTLAVINRRIKINLQQQQQNQSYQHFQQPVDIEKFTLTSPSLPSSTKITHSDVIVNADKLATVKTDIFVRASTFAIDVGSKTAAVVDIGSNSNINNKSSSNDVAELGKVLSEKEKVDLEALTQMRLLARAGRLDESFDLALQLFETFKNDPLVIVEIGSLQYFRGNYEAAFQLCSRGVELRPDSAIAHGCKGVAGMYLMKQEETLAAFRAAWRLSRGGGGEASPLAQLRSTVFALTPDAIEINMLSALKSFKAYEECTDIVSAITDLPAMSVGGSVVFIFAFVDWSPIRYPALAILEQNLRQRGILQLPNDRTLISEILRIQAKFGHVFNPAIECLTNGANKELGDAVIKLLMQVVDWRADKTEPVGDAGLPENARHTIKNKVSMQHQSSSLQGIILITQYFQPSDSDALLDINNVLVKNLANDAISEIYLLDEQEYDFSQFPKAGKIHQVRN